MGIFDRKVKDLENQSVDKHDELDNTGLIRENAAVEKKQRLLLYGGGGVVALAAMWWILGDNGKVDTALEDSSNDTQVSTDAMVNRQEADQQWMSRYDHQLTSQENRLKGLDKNAERVGQVQDELQSLRAENQQMKADTQRVLEAYQRENDQLKREIEQGAPSGGSGAQGPVAAANAMGIPGAARGGGSGMHEVKLVSFDGPQKTGDARKIDGGGKSAATYTDSPNYLPPNSIAKAKVVVGVDAATNVRSQSDPLPVLLRVTGPARSVFSDGKLLRTEVQGCMVNGAAYGDLSSEKVYVKLQRMTCPQPGGRYAVSEVKGFISFGGKVGLRGRVVSREGGLIGQAFLAGMAGGFGRGFSANANSIFSGTNVTVDGEKQQLSTGDILKGGLGEGVSQAGDTVSDYLIERAEQYQPVIEMPTGADVEVVFLDGTFIRN
ncbi:conjugal transfer protein TraB [Novosphingobium profundi]|uniref:TraB/VirB10 family protein n=1 Tax=Novosphingobium profundi TaxID=1774954 RepID=UPI001BD9AB85|nr:TrbI/VirB10 family protein [Novosphingobium profundi]MBT0671582.1 conjugal transfer protein TraB [Novosphingobium profundi]